MGNEIRRYCNTDELIEKEGKLYIHPDRVWLTDEPDPDAGVSIDMWKHEEQFFHDAGLEYPIFNMGEMYAGKYGLPKWAYDPETDTFESVETWKMEWGRHNIRRREIDRDINVSGVKITTELKKIRKCVKAIVAAIPELRDLEEVVDFLGLSEFIETKITKHEKDTTKAETEAKKANREEDDWWMGRPGRGRQDEEERSAHRRAGGETEAPPTDRGAPAGDRGPTESHQRSRNDAQQD